MIISHKHKYIFIELPLTASTAIAKELKELYEGEEIMYKHASYSKFLKQANEKEKKYFSFSGIRNPLDQAVSHYFKYLSDHKNKYSKPPKRKKGVGKIKYLIDQSIHQKKFKFISANNPSFEEFFLKFYNIPYSNWSLVHHKAMNAVIRFENLQEDFESTLKSIGIEPVRSLPRDNKTAQKEKSFWEYFESKESKEKAAKIFGPYMTYWNYEFPKSWNVDHLVNNKATSYKFYNALKKIYWKL